MNDSKISVRYAKALFKSALEKGIADRVIQDLNYISEIVQTDDFKYLMKNPVIKTSEKIDAVSKLFKEKIHEFSLRFFILILRQKRESYLERIIRNIQSFYRSHKGILSVQLIVPVKVDKETKNRFFNILSDSFKTEIELTEKVKPGIVGGFILRIEDEQLDNSVTTALSKMKESLSVK